MLGLDYSSGHPRGAAVRAAGYNFVIRYCGQPTNPKNATAAEVGDMLAAGVAVALVFESTAARAGEGFAAGVADAHAATAHQAALGIPSSRPIYYAVDYDADPATIEPYFRGLQSVAGPDAAYGSARVVQRLLDDQLAVAGWQTVAWSRGQLVPGRAVFQRLGTVVVDGIQCDVNEALIPDFGQHPAPGHSPAFEEDDMWKFLVDNASKQASDGSYTRCAELLPTGALIGTSWDDIQAKLAEARNGGAPASVRGVDTGVFEDYESHSNDLKAAAKALAKLTSVGGVATAPTALTFDLAVTGTATPKAVEAP